MHKLNFTLADSPITLNLSNDYILTLVLQDVEQFPLTLGIFLLLLFQFACSLVHIFASAKVFSRETSLTLICAFMMLSAMVNSRYQVMFTLDLLSPINLMYFFFLLVAGCVGGFSVNAMFCALAVSFNLLAVDIICNGYILHTPSGFFGIFCGIYGICVALEKYGVLKNVWFFAHLNKIKFLNFLVPNSQYSQIISLKLHLCSIFSLYCILCVAPENAFLLWLSVSCHTLMALHLLNASHNGDQRFFVVPLVEQFKNTWLLCQRLVLNYEPKNILNLAHAVGMMCFISFLGCPACCFAMDGQPICEGASWASFNHHILGGIRA